MVVEEFTNSLKSLLDNTTEELFKVFVDQLLKTYENIFLHPETLSDDLRLTVASTHHMLMNEKNKYLRSLKFTNFQDFCRDFCKQMRVIALMQGNITELHAKSIMQNVLNALNFDEVKDVSILFITYS